MDEDIKMQVIKKKHWALHSVNKIMLFIRMSLYKKIAFTGAVALVLIRYPVGII